MSRDLVSEKTDIYHNDALNALMQADQALAYAPSLAIDAPHLQSDVTQNWLQKELGDAVAGAKLEKLTIEDEHDGMTSRKRWALQWNNAGREAKLPNSLFVKATPEDVAHREMLAVLHMHEVESRFYKHIQPEISDLAPKAYYAESYPGGRFIILLEDLEASACKPYWLKDQVGIDHIRAMTVTLAKLHAKYWQSKRLHGDLSWVRPRTCRYGWQWLSKMTSDVRRAFPAMADEELLPKELVDVLTLWDKHADSVFNYFETLPHTVLHGDSHLGNSFGYPDGRAGLFDWQCMFSGHGLRDFAYFVFSAINEEERKIHEKELFDLYLETLAEYSIKMEREQAWNDYCLFVLDRWDAGIMTFVHGTYGHDQEAQRRGFWVTNGAILDNDIGGRLESLIRTTL